jgi:hypothetical protein
MGRFVMIPLAIVVLAIAACGDDDAGGGETFTVTETTTSAEETSSDDGDGAAPAADLEVTELTAFQSPSGNIGCQIDRESVRCDIGERDWQPPAPPADCDLDFGQGISLSAGGTAEFVCAGDTTLGAGEQLAYGRSISAGLLRCESSSAGITCRDIESGRGFSIARKDFERF